MVIKISKNLNSKKSVPLDFGQKIVDYGLRKVRSPRKGFQLDYRLPSTSITIDFFLG